MTTFQNPKDMSRRKFMALAGGAAVLAAMAAMGLSAEHGECSANIPEIDIDKMTCAQNEADVLVIGGGMAGLFAAVKAHDAGSKVMLVSKGRLGSSGQTPFAKGIFAFDPSSTKISLDEFVDTVSRSALGTNNPVYTRQMAEHSLARVNELREWGFFESPLCNNCFNKPIQERNIPVKERIVITHLMKEKGQISGAAGFSLDEEKVHFFKAKSVILCTGAGGFKPNGFPLCDLTHDGTIMAYSIGAKVTGKEWNDGHPGQAKNAAACFDGWHGMFERKPGITGVEIHHDLGVDLNYMAYMTGNPIEMGTPGIEGGPGGSGHAKLLTLRKKCHKNVSEMVLIGRFSPQNCPVKRIDPKMSGVKRHYIIGQFLHENGSIKTEILVFLDLFSQFFNKLLWPDPVAEPRD